MHHGRVSDDGQVAPRAADDGLAQRHGVFAALRKLFLDAPVEEFVLEEKHRVIVADGRFQQALGVVGGGRTDHFQARRVHEMHFGIRGMKRSAVHAASGRAADDDRNGRAPQVVRLGRVVGDRVERAGDEVHELHLDHRAQPEITHAHGRADDGRFADGRIDHALPAEPFQQAGGGLERAAVDADVLAEEHHGRIALHLFGQRLANGFEIGDLGHASSGLLAAVPAGARRNL